MEYIIIIVTCIVFLIITKFALRIKIKEIKMLKELGFNKELNEITDKLPENKDVCKEILKMLKNESVVIKESKDTKSSFYFVLTNSILLSNIKDTFTRIQTIAHECLHSVQNRRMLLFNFIYSNVYIVLFFILCILTLLNLISNPLIVIFILTILGLVYYTIRSYLETEAMTKAKYLAKDYMKDKLYNEEINDILENYEKINNIGIRTTNFMLLWKIVSKIIIYCICATI